MLAEIIWGTASGLLMSILFVGVGAVLLVAVAGEPPAWLKGALKQVPIIALAVPLVLLSQALWALVGLIMGLFYRLASIYAPGPGLGSPNAIYTLGVVAFAAAACGPVFLLARPALKGVLVIVLSFVGIFGWFLPIAISWQ